MFYFSSRYCSMNPLYYQNNYIDPTESTKLNYSNCLDSKPSNTIERLQMLLQTKASDSLNEPIQYSPSSIHHDNSHWTSSSYISKTKSDTIMQNNNNNQTFTYNDTEKLLTMVQRLRN